MLCLPRFPSWKDEKVTEFYDDEAFTEVAQAGEQIVSWNKGFCARRCIRWGIARREDDRVIGSCGYYGFHGWHNRASIGYELARPFWRQGMMSEALRAIVHFGFEDAGLNRIQAVVMPGNRASIGLLEKLGFGREGVLRAYENWGDKGYVDVAMFSLLKGEYENGCFGTDSTTR
jgi:ribosomal-protein-alanine N-acetyltransferase